MTTIDSFVLLHSSAHRSAAVCQRVQAKNLCYAACLSRMPADCVPWTLHLQDRPENKRDICFDMFQLGICIMIDVMRTFSRPDESPSVYRFSQEQTLKDWSIQEIL